MQKHLHSGFVVVVLLVSVFLILNWATLARDGIRLGGDSPRYIRGAENLLYGLPFEGKQTSYLGYVAIVALYQRAGIGLQGIVATQIAFAALAAVALYDLGRKLYGNWAGLIAAGLLIANPDIARWHSYILTDSLYISMIILATWSVHRAAEKKGAWYIIAAIIVLAAALLRPNGWILLPIAVSYWITQGISRKGLRWLAVAGVVVIFIVLGAISISHFRAGIQAENPGLMLRRGEVIWGYEPWRIPMPFEPEPIEYWTAAFGYVFRHPLASFRLAIARVAAELIHIRPFYSIWHNSILLASLPLLYVLALIGFIRTCGTPLARLIMVVVISHMMVIALTFADWDGRFLLYVFPLICLFSSWTIASWLLRRIYKLSYPSQTGQ